MAPKKKFVNVFLVNIPFRRIILSKNKRKDFIIENHFLCQVPTEEKILLVSKFKGKPMSIDKGLILEKCTSTPNELISMLNKGYEKIKELLDREVSEEKRTKGYYKKFLASEMRRLFFGGWMQKPPVPELNNNAKLALLYDLYRSVLGETSHLNVFFSEELYLQFRVNPSDKSFVALEKRYSSYQKILTSLWRKNKIKIDFL